MLHGYILLEKTYLNKTKTTQNETKLRTKKGRKRLAAYKHAQQYSSSTHDIDVNVAYACTLLRSAEHRSNNNILQAIQVENTR